LVQGSNHEVARQCAQLFVFLTAVKFFTQIRVRGAVYYNFVSEYLVAFSVGPVVTVLSTENVLHFRFQYKMFGFSPVVFALHFLLSFPYPACLTVSRRII